MYRPCKELFERAQLAVNGTDLSGVNWDEWITSRQSHEQECGEEIGWGLGHEGMEYTGGVLEDFAFTVEQQFQASTSI